jgi:DNA-directed RNA polymerase subunit M/transcription elongation factor TFIIS
MESETFYRDNIEGLSEEDKGAIDKMAASLGFGPKYKPKPTPKYKCPKCGENNAYYKEIHPDTGMDEIVLRCPDCGCDTERD